MGKEEEELTITLDYEGDKRQFRLSEPIVCGRKDQLQLTGVIYETWPRQFEIKCNCGCEYRGIAFLVEEIEQTKNNLP